jgi:hypothetical protein
MIKAKNVTENEREKSHMINNAPPHPYRATKLKAKQKQLN